MADPIVYLAKGPGVKAVVTFAAFAADVHEPRAEKNAQVLGDGGPGHGEGRSDPVDGKFAAAEEVENAAARGIADGGEYITLRWVRRAFHAFYNR